MPEPETGLLGEDFASSLSHGMPMSTCINNEERKGRERKGKGESVSRGSAYGLDTCVL